MAKLTPYSLRGKRLKRGHRIVTGAGWRLTRRKSETLFIGTLIKTFNVGSQTLGVFKIRRPKKSEIE